MAKLILTLDGVVLKEYALTKERTTIGRKAHNDVQIDNLAVSGEHAAIVTILSDSFLEDLGSTNGTLVNGQPIKKHFLQNGDMIEIGKYKVKYINEQASTGAAAADFEKTMVLRTSARPAMETKPGDTQTGTATQTGIRTDLRRGPTETSTNVNMHTTTGYPGPGVTSPGGTSGLGNPGNTFPGAGSAPTVQGVIQILSGPNAGRELPLLKALTTLGKPGVQVAVIAKRPQGFFITHVEGANFPMVNGRTLDAQAHLLNDHDIIELAGVKMEFFFKPAA